MDLKNLPHSYARPSYYITKLDWLKYFLNNCKDFSVVIGYGCARRARSR
ncbi:MAG: hypothetical protein ACKPCM_07410 [Pseudanabaena sp.]